MSVINILCSKEENSWFLPLDATILCWRWEQLGYLLAQACEWIQDAADATKSQQEQRGNILVKGMLPEYPEGSSTHIPSSTP